MTSLGSRNFMIAAGILLVAALGLNVAVAKLQLHFKKEPVPMRKSFTEAMPEVIEAQVMEPSPTGSERSVTHHWVQACRDEHLQADILISLGTDQFLFCDYIDAEAFGMSVEEVQAAFHDPQDKKLLPLSAQQEVLRDKFLAHNPLAVVQLGLTYYTGKADTVAHIPERCYVGGGFDPVDPTTEQWGLGRGISVRSIQFTNLTDQAKRNVAYFFQVNGRYDSDSLGVRADLQDLFTRNGYYAKVEMMCISADRQKASTSMQRFLGAALPSIESALPDWNQYKTSK